MMSVRTVKPASRTADQSLNPSLKKITSKADDENAKSPPTTYSDPEEELRDIYRTTGEMFSWSMPRRPEILPGQ